MTPDWAAKPVTVPYAKFGDPQTLNLYSYVENSPINQADADGHIAPSVCGNDGDKCKTALQSVAAHAAATGTGIQATRRDYNAKVNQQTTIEGRDAVKAEYREKGPALGRTVAKEAGEDPARVAARAAKPEAELAKSITRTSEAVNDAAEAFGTAGKVAGVVAVSIAVYDVATAPSGEKVQTALKEGGSLTGAMYGGEVGATIGATRGPVGALVGGIGGSIVGGFVGKEGVNQILSNNPTPEEQDAILRAVN